MQYFAYSLAVWLILIMCGLPLAFVLLPANLRRLVVPMAPLFGYSYIVYVGYFFYRSNIGGTDFYTPFLLAPPLVGLLLLIWRGHLSAAGLFGRQAMLMVALAAFSFLFLSSVFMLAQGRAVSMAFSNLDVVELASVSRYLQEFARGSAVGFLGQTDHFKVTGDSIWFGPSMIVAVMSSATFSEPFRLQSLVMTVVASQGAAFVYIIARHSLSLDRRVALGVAALYAINPIIAYTVWQSFGGQMISIALMLAMTYLVMRAQTEPPEPRIQFQYLPALLLLFSALLVTYHFMIAIICVLLGFYITMIAISERSVKRFWTGAALMSAAVVLALALNPIRLPGLLATLTWINAGENGWFIPWLSPDIQLGFEASRLLMGGGFPLGRTIGIAIVCALAVVTVLHLMRERELQSHRAFFIAIALPIFLFGFFYAFTEAREGVLGSYRSYKITSTFTAFTLLSLSLWFGARPLRLRSIRAAAAGVVAAILVAVCAIDLHAMLQFNKYVTYTPSEELRQIARIESMDFVDTVNIMNDTNFDQFWAHYFTLHKRQFFEAFAYGGRVIGTLPDSYQLRRNAGPTGWGTDIFVVQQGPCLESYPITSRLTLCKARGRLDATVTPGDGWWALEPDWSGRIPGWRWSGRNGRIADVVIENRSVGGQVSIKATYEELSPNNSISLSVNGEAVPVTVTATELRSAPVVLKVGRNVARFTVELDPILPANDARRTIGIMWKQVLILPSDLLGE